MASAEFGQWLLRLHAIIDAEHPGYDRSPDRWRPYFNSDHSPRDALQTDMKQSAKA